MPSGSKPYRFDRLAREDLRQGALFYEQRRNGLGSRFNAHVQNAVELIAQAPERWPVRRGTHRYVLRRFPYTIAYKITDKEIVIIAVAHQRLDPENWESR